MLGIQQSSGPWRAPTILATVVACGVACGVAVGHPAESVERESLITCFSEGSDAAWENSEPRSSPCPQYLSCLLELYSGDTQPKPHLRLRTKLGQRFPLPTGMGLSGQNLGSANVLTTLPPAPRKEIKQGQTLFPTCVVFSHPTDTVFQGPLTKIAGCISPWQRVAA